ncbi:PPOX class F420-dependent oxidoreductase [Streptomyces sp. NPDC093568]|uniref:PPOX class F420-dependent oxidoreductase n=1 Tax=Streptomyces sp. NPDC093568 TaxID=3366041 RepID=UPI00381324E8
MTAFSEAERVYLTSQRLGRLATVDPAGQPQANPVGFFPQDDGTILIGGRAMGATKKWRNLRANPKVALVVDDLASVRPWRVRGVEVRGDAELLTGPHGLGPHFSEEVIRIHPRWVRSWGLEEED